MTLALTLQDAPHATSCRELLGDLERIEEKRKGRMLFVYTYALVTSPVILLIAIFSLNNRTVSSLLGDTIPLVLFLASGLFALGITVWLVAREMQLIEQAISSRLSKVIQPLLHADEPPLVLISGQITSAKTPTWLRSGHPSAFFIFTTDRLLVLTINKLMVGASTFHNHFSNGTFGQLVDSIYTVDLADKNSVDFGGLHQKSLLFGHSHTTMTFAPINETDTLTVMLANRHTRAGQLLKTIRHRLENGYSRYF